MAEICAKLGHSSGRPYCRWCEPLNSIVEISRRAGAQQCCAPTSEVQTLRDDFDEEAVHPGHRSIRFKGYDYTSEGFYFITICSHQKRCVFGRIVDARAVLSSSGLILRECWVAIPSHFGRTRLHEFVIMPNHLHGIVEICSRLGRSSAAPLRGDVVAACRPGRLGRLSDRSRRRLQKECMKD
jgi:REP element-mobilizing transposase RayT